MAKSHSSFACQNCGAVSNRWQGKCEVCSEWNTIVEEGAPTGIGAQFAQQVSARGVRKGRIITLEGLAGDTRPPPRVLSGIGELDRVAGGGL